ncbi:MAG: response regulator [Proteobacteria bacterium]|nr:response regulator [Pseudomonadota bacterium]
MDNAKTTQGNILIIDDAPENLRLLDTLLSNAGYQVRPTSDARMGLLSAQRKLPDIILLDIKMPGMNGYEVCEQLKADERTRDIPVIFISALNETIDKVHGFALGGVDYIAKPFQDAEVLARVERHLTIRNLQKQLEEQNVQLASVNSLLTHEIAERKRVEKSSRESEEKFKALFSNAQVALFRTRISDGKLLEINEQYAHMAGYATIEECMTDFNAADAWADPTARDELVRILGERGSVTDYETVINQRDGTHKPIIFSATIFQEQGFLEGSIVDITQRKRAEEALRESEERFSLFVDHFPGVAFINSAEGTTIFGNKHICEFYGCTREEYVGKKLEELVGLELAGQMAEQDNKVLSKGDSPPLECC